MKTNRWFSYGTAAAALIALCAPARAQGRLDADLLKLYGGVFSTQCHNARATRLRVVDDALMVDEGGKRMTGRNVQAAHSFFGQSPPPDYQVALLSDVQRDLQLLFIVFRDRSGQYIRLDGDQKVTAALGKTLLTRKYYSCDPNKNAPPSQTSAAPSSGSAPAVIYGPTDLLKDAKFKSAYFKGLGPKAKERWLTDLDGPAPEAKKVRVGGTEYVLASVCKPHDCGDNNMVILYSAAQGAVYAKIFEGGRRATLIGAPPPDVASELDRLWQAEWRQNR